MHIRAKPGDVAELAVIMGDPARVEQAASLLDDARIINSYRGYLAYTGRYEGIPVTVACHCIGGPSAAIAVEELAMLGARRIVRIGTAGAFAPAVGESEVVVPGEAFHVSTLPMMYSGVAGPSIADPGLSERLAREVEATGLRVHRGSVFSSDAFYLEGPEIVERWRSAGAVAVEMECATVFAVAAARGISAAAALIVSNNLATRSRVLTSDELKPITLRTVRAAIRALKP
ncbi:Purine nucleoside phosphorylase [Conexivisphaera calida]|uniref:Purine nucleoside phosphorylase n=1 Tax=Conexivisphaera calida TaxID=1874277 RepID=A0A4P2VGJ8_9ARCH|nr:Purine nucleoside phosphorylase [Conexivisphaera calida]